MSASVCLRNCSFRACFLWPWLDWSLLAGADPEICHMGSHSVTCHPAEVTFPPLPQPKLVLDLATPEGCKAELTCACIGQVWIISRAPAVVRIFTATATITHCSRSVVQEWAWSVTSRQ